MFFNSSSEPCEEIGGLLAELEEDRSKINTGQILTMKKFFFIAFSFEIESK